MEFVEGLAAVFAGKMSEMKAKRFRGFAPVFCLFLLP